MQGGWISSLCSSPSIYNEEGLEIYGRYFVNIRYASKYGLVTYVHSENDAMKKRMTGRHPCFTIALKGMKGCPVISNRDTRKIFSSRKTVEKLKKCKVIFIIDKEKN